jgi:hypothetical protein
MHSAPAAADLFSCRRLRATDHPLIFGNIPVIPDDFSGFAPTGGRSTEEIYLWQPPP